VTGPQNTQQNENVNESSSTPREQTQREVEELRAEVGDTVEELVHRVDVPTRLREKRAETTERVQAQVTHAREVVAEKAPAVQSALRERPGIVGAVAAVLVLLLLRRLRRRRQHRKEDVDGTR
jgi:hypothetical protein